jgi:acetyltransferase-like isoleucine patch superfamily enzyme
MATVTIPFGANPAETLVPLGLRLPTLTGTRQIDQRSAFEPPVFVQATLPMPSWIEVGAFSSISGGSISAARIGRYCAIAPDVVIGANEHPVDWLTSSRVAYYPVVHGWDAFCRPDRVEFIRANAKPFAASFRMTTIGHDVWIGQGAFIRSGVTLGTGCVVAARAVVTSDVPPYAVVAGVPAKIRRYRFPEATIERLLAAGWWRYSLYDCFELPFHRVEEALDRLEEMVALGTLAEYRPQPITAEDLCALFAAPPGTAPSAADRPPAMHVAAAG